MSDEDGGGKVKWFALKEVIIRRLLEKEQINIPYLLDAMFEGTDGVAV